MPTAWARSPGPAVPPGSGVSSGSRENSQGGASFQHHRWRYRRKKTRRGGRPTSRGIRSLAWDSMWQLLSSCTASQPWKIRPRLPVTEMEMAPSIICLSLPRGCPEHLCPLQPRCPKLPALWSTRVFPRPPLTRHLFLGLSNQHRVTEVMHQCGLGRMSLQARCRWAALPQ